MSCSPEECQELSDAINYANEMAGYHQSVASYESDLAAFYAAQSSSLQGDYAACECGGGALVAAAADQITLPPAATDRTLLIRRQMALTNLRCEMRHKQFLIEQIERLV